MSETTTLSRQTREVLTSSSSSSDEELERLRYENETLRALLFVQNARSQLLNNVEGSSSNTSKEGSKTTQPALTDLMDRALELRAMYLLTRADALVLREEISEGLKELKKTIASRG